MSFSPDAPTGTPKIVRHGVTHLRAEPKSSAEQVSQTLAGRVVSVLDTSENETWTRVQTDDTYQGWLETRWLGDMPNDTAPPFSLIGTVFAEVREAPTIDAPPIIRLPILCGVRQESRVRTAPGNEEWAEIVLPDDQTRGFVPVSALAPLPDSPDENTPHDAAQWWGREFLGTPYLWGGSSSFGLDCSGFTQICYRLAGNIILRRDADIQRSDERFAPVEKSNLQPGDLVFFGKPDKITHVGMHYKENTFIHSAGGAGVLITEWGDTRYSPGFVDARRLIPVKMFDAPTRFEGESDR